MVIKCNGSADVCQNPPKQFGKRKIPHGKPDDGEVTNEITSERKEVVMDPGMMYVSILM